MRASLVALLTVLLLGSAVAQETGGGEVTTIEGSREVVVLLHGVWRSGWSLMHLGANLEQADYEIHNEGYASLREDIPTNAERVWNEVSQIEADRIHFVTHSMGGLVLRQMLAEHELPNLGRTVMLAPPSRGAELADFYSQIPIYPVVMGNGSMQLRRGEDGIGAQVPPPPGEFAIIAGAKGDPGGRHMLIPGDDDGTVGVSETWLPGCKAFRTVRSGHSLIMYRQEVIDLTLQFLKTGEMAPLSAEP